MCSAFHPSLSSSFFFPLAALCPAGHAGWPLGLLSCLWLPLSSQFHSSTFRPDQACSFFWYNLWCLARWCSRRLMRPEITHYLLKITVELADILGIALDEAK